MDRVEAVAAAHPGAVLHDVGCGNGQLLFEARRRGWRVQGNDVVSNSGVRRLMELSGIRCLIGNLSELELELGSCDVVTSFCVLPHHLADPTPEMRVVQRILKPGDRRSGSVRIQPSDSGQCSPLLYARGGRPDARERDVEVSRRLA